MKHILNCNFRHLRNGEFSLGAVGARHDVADTGAGMLHLLKMGLKRTLGMGLHGSQGGHMAERQVPQARKLEVIHKGPEARGMRRRCQGSVVRCRRERIVREGWG